MAVVLKTWDELLNNGEISVPDSLSGVYAVTS